MRLLCGLNRLCVKEFQESDSPGTKMSAQGGASRSMPQPIIVRPESRQGAVRAPCPIAGSINRAIVRGIDKLKQKGGERWQGVNVASLRFGQIVVVARAQWSMSLLRALFCSHSVNSQRLLWSGVIDHRDCEHDASRTAKAAEVCSTSAAINVLPSFSHLPCVYPPIPEGEAYGSQTH